MLNIAYVHTLCFAACANAGIVFLPAMHAVHRSSDMQKASKNYAACSYTLWQIPVPC